jgi:hypothetical protein
VGKGRSPDKPRPKSYALTDFLLCGCYLLPITAEEALINARGVRGPYPILPRLRLLVIVRHRSPATLVPGAIGVVLSLAHPACLNGPPEALRTLVAGVDTLLAREDRLRLELSGGVRENVYEGAPCCELRIRGG